MTWYDRWNRAVHWVIRPVLDAAGVDKPADTGLHAARLSLHPSMWYLRPERRNAKVPGLLDISFLCFTLYLAWRAKWPK